MSDELNPYPGNLKHHRVDPLLSDELIEQFNEDQHEQCAFDWKMSEDASFHFTNGHLAGMREIIPHYEASRAKDAELIQRLVDAGDVMKQWLGLTLQMDGESCPDCGYDWGKGHNYGCAQLQHQKSIDEWDAAKTAGFKPSDQ